MMTSSLIGATRSVRSGFTLLEVLAVTVLIGITAAVVVPRLGRVGGQAKLHVCHQYRADLNALIERYRFARNALPKTLDELSSDEFYGTELPVCPVDGTRYTIDLQNGRVAGHQH